MMFELLKRRFCRQGSYAQYWGEVEWSQRGPCKHVAALGTLQPLGMLEVTVELKAAVWCWQVEKSGRVERAGKVPAVAPLFPQAGYAPGLLRARELALEAAWLIATRR